jgi:transposase
VRGFGSHRGSAIRLVEEGVRIDRLVAAGKPKKVAIVAYMRKLLTVLNAMVRFGASWDESIHLS